MPCAEPLETGDVVVAQGQRPHPLSGPGAGGGSWAMNPCKCGFGGMGGGALAAQLRPARCQQQYQARVSGPFIDRIDLQIEVPPVTAADLSLPPPAEGTAEAAARLAVARDLQIERARRPANAGAHPQRARAEEVTSSTRSRRWTIPPVPCSPRAAHAAALTARGWTRTIRLARTIADLEGSDAVRRIHVAEALIYRRGQPGRRGRPSAGHYLPRVAPRRAVPSTRTRGGGRRSRGFKVKLTLATTGRSNPLARLPRLRLNSAFGN